MSPGLTASPAGQVLGRAYDRHEPDRQLQARDRRDGLDHGSAAGHVELHLGHLRAGLQRDAAAVERHRLADEAEHGPTRAGARIAKRDQCGLLLGALGDRGEGAHAAVDDPVSALDLDGQTLDLVGERLGVLGKRRRRQVVAWAVLQVAGGVGGLGDQRGIGDGTRQIPRRLHDQRLQVLRRGIFVGLSGGRLVALEAVVGEDRALDERGGDLLAGVVGQHPAERARRQLASAVARHRGRDTRALGRELLDLAEANGQPALAVRVRQRERLERVARLAAGEQRG